MFKRLIKILSSLFIALLTLLIIIIIAAPTIFSSDWGKRQLLSTFNKDISGRVEIDKLRISWFDRQHIEGFRLFDASNKELISASLFSTKQALWDLLWSGMRFSHSKVRDLNVVLDESKTGLSSIELALRAAPINSVVFSDPIRISDVDVDINIPSGGGTHEFRLKGKIIETKRSGTFFVDNHYIPIKGPHPLNYDNLNININLTHCPVRIFDFIARKINNKWQGLPTALIGDELSLSISEKGDNSFQKTEWKIDAPRLHTQFEMDIDPEFIRLSAPTSFNFSISPELWSRFFHDLNLRSAAQFSAKISDLFIPITKDLTTFSTDATFTLSDISLLPDNAQTPIEFTSLKGLIKTAEDESNIHVELENKELGLRANILKPTERSQVLNAFFTDSTIHAYLKNFPLALIDSLTPNLKAVKFIGDTLSLTIDSEFKNAKGVARLFLESPHLSSENLNVIYSNHKITLAEPAYFTYQIIPGQLTHPDLFSLQKKGILSGEISALSFSTITPLDWKNTQLNAKVASSSPLLFSSESNTIFSIDHLNLQLSGKSLKQSIVEASADMRSNAEKDAIIQDLVGNEMHLSFSSHLNILTPTDWSLENLQAEINSDIVNAQINASLSPNRFTLNKPLGMELNLTPALAKEITTRLNSRLILEKTTKLALHAAPFEINFTHKQMPSFAATGQLGINKAILNVNNSLIELNQIMIPWDANSEQVLFQFSGKAGLADTKNQGTLKGKIHISNWLSSPIKTTHTQVQLVDFPSLMIAAITGEIELTALLGQLVNVDLDFISGQNKQKDAFDVTIKGDDFHLSAALMGEHVLQLRNPDQAATLSCKLNQDRLQLLTRRLITESYQNPIQLSRPADINLTISSLNLPWKSDDTQSAFPYWLAGIKADLNIHSLFLSDQDNKSRMQLNSLAASIDSQNLSEKVQFTVQGDPKHSGKGSIDCSGTLSELFLNTGKLNTETLSAELDASVQELDTQGFCLIFCPSFGISKKVSALVGHSLNGEVHIFLNKMNGPIEVKLNGSHGRLHLNGTANNGLLSLNEPFIAQVRASPELGEEVLKDIVPFLASLRSSDKPISFIIDPKDFSFPMNHKRIDQLHIASAAVEVGKMRFANKGSLKAVTGLLGNINAQEVEIWLTPIYFQMQKGVLYLQRFDMLLNRAFPIATWGQLNFTNDNIHMIVGITGIALQKAFGIQDLSPNFILQVPVKGSLDKPKIDKKKAAARISSLVAERQGREGKIIGTFIDLASGKFKEGKVPPPTTQPFPWTVDHTSN